MVTMTGVARAALRGDASPAAVAPPPPLSRSMVRIAPYVTSALARATSARSGSGVVIRYPDDVGTSSAGRCLVLTAAHVASMAGAKNALLVTTCGGGRRERRGRVVGVSRACDLALVALDGDDDADADDEAFVPLEVARSVCDSMTGRNGIESWCKRAVVAYGEPQAYAAFVGSLTAAARGFGSVIQNANDYTSGDYYDDEYNGDVVDDDADKECRGRGVILGTYCTSHILHDARVLAGMSGGALVDARARRVLGVHSFGDAFYGGSRDVAVVAERAFDTIEIDYDGVAPEEYATARVNAMIMSSSDAALAALVPELDAKTRASWIL